MFEEEGKGKFTGYIRDILRSKSALVVQSSVDLEHEITGTCSEVSILKRRHPTVQ